MLDFFRVGTSATLLIPAVPGTEVGDSKMVYWCCLFHYVYLSVCLSAGIDLFRYRYIVISSCFFLF